MKSHLDVAKLLRQRIQHYKKMAANYSSLTTMRQQYIKNKMQYVVPNLERALCKIREGTREVCDNCEGEISHERLKAVPGAIYCIACQEKVERKFK